MFLHYLLVLLSAASLDAYSSGAPAKACQTLYPLHPGKSAQSTPTFYTITPGANRLVQGSNLRVVVSSDQASPFGGFILQARNPLAPNEPLGTFVAAPDETKIVDCPPTAKNTVTQKDPKPKTYLEFEWQPPVDYIGTVVFNGTVLQDYATFWVGIQSEAVQVVKRSLADSDGQSAGISTTRRPKVTTPPPTLRPRQPFQDKATGRSMTEGCGAGSKTCFGTPSGCVDRDDCTTLVTVNHDTVVYTFELYSAPLAGMPNTYVAVGLSADNKMAEDSVVQCLSVGGTVSIASSWNIAGPGNVPTPTTENPAQLVNASSTDGDVYCKFTREPITTHNNVEFNLDTTPYYLLIARGMALAPTTIVYHSEREATSEALLLWHASTPASSSKVLLRLHAAFMITAWIGAASIGILLARYFKQTWVGSQLCGKDQWFAWHRVCMLLTWTLTIVAFILIFVELKAWSSVNNPHAILGTCTTILAFIQPFMAAFRPEPSSPKRPIFNWFHWLVGNAAHILAIVTIFFATKLAKAEVPAWLDWIIVSYVAFHVLMHLTFSIIGCNAEKSNSKRVSSFAMKDMNSGRNPLGATSRNQDAPKSKLRKVLLGIYITVIIMLTIAILVIAVMAPIETSYQKLKKYIMP